MIERRATAPWRFWNLLPPIFPILAAAGLIITLLLYRETFREATIDLSIGRATAEQRALEFLAAQGVSAGQRWRSSSFQTDTTAQDYLIASAGLDELEALAQQDLKFASWHVRLFTPLDPVEWSVDVSSRTGRVLSYQHVLKEETPGATLSITSAEQLALEALAARPGGGPAPGELRLLARRVTRQPNRTDQAFTWERPALKRGDATYRYSVTIAGDQVGRIDEYYNIPESWSRLARWHARRGALLNTIGWTAAFALMAGLGLAWLQAAGRRLLRLRFALTLLIAIGLVGLATALNSLPLFLASLPTDVSVAAYLADQLGAYGGTALMLGATVIVAGMAGEALAWTAGLPRRREGERVTGREGETNAVSPRHPVTPSPSPVVSLSRMLTLRGLASAPIVRGLLVGLCVGVAQLGYVTLFYWIGQRWFGVWAPVDPNYDDALSTPLPWLYAIALGLLPAVGEELVFRLGGISLLRRATGMPRLAVVATAVIWASLHTTYSQQPFYIRLVELTFVGIVFGTLFLRYGVISSMAAHYTYNAALMAPLLAQGSLPTRAGMVLAVGGATLLLLPALARWRRGQPLEGAEVLAAPLPSDQQTGRGGEGAISFAFSPPLTVSSSKARWLPVLALAGLAAWLLALWLVPQPPLLDRTLARGDALAHGQAAAADLGLSTSGLFGAAYSDATLLGLDPGYLREHPGAGDLGQVIARDGARASWRVRFSQWDRDDTLALWLGARGELVAFDRGLPEDAPGQAIPQAQARGLAAGLLARQGFDLASAALVESSTITRTNRVDHRFVWESERVVGEAAHPRVLVAVQGDQLATLSPYLYTPPEYRRERDRTTVLRQLERDTIPLLPEFAALLLSGAGLLLATRRRPPLRLIVAAGLAGAGVTLIGGLLRLDAAQLAQPPRLLQGFTYAVYSAILSGAELGLVAGGAAMLWARAFPTAPGLDAQGGVSGFPRQARAVFDGHIRNGCALALALLPALLAFGALRAGLAAEPGGVRSPGGLDSLLPAATLLLEGAGAALRSALLLAGVSVLLASWRPLRRFALPLATLGAVLVAARPDRLALLALALLAWPIASWLGWRWLSPSRMQGGKLVALFLALWWAACLPDALALFALGQWWYAANGALAILLLLAPIVLLRRASGE